ncbi:MAG: hypothetical protein IJ724_03820 [Muribaculaceae bacterium]|nr:hypothetical protein [Muribaculaceae bacterium]
MKLQKALNISADILVSALTEYVRQNGQPYHADGDKTDNNGNEYNYWDAAMDINEGMGERITKILDLYAWQGCEITTQKTLNPSSEDDCIDNIFETQAIYALYIVERKGEEQLWYYSLYNSGARYNEEESNPVHATVDAMDVDELVLLSATIIHCENNN